MDKKEFTPATGRTVVIDFRMVIPIPDASEQHIDEILDAMNGYGTGVITNRMLVADGYQEAAEVLRTHQYVGP